MEDLEWLGERECESQEEIQNFISSNDFKNVGERLLKENLLSLQMVEYALLAKSYPVAVNAISVFQMLKGINLV